MNAHSIWIERVQRVHARMFPCAIHIVHSRTHNKRTLHTTLNCVIKIAQSAPNSITFLWIFHSCTVHVRFGSVCESVCVVCVWMCLIGNRENLHPTHRIYNGCKWTNETYSCNSNWMRQSPHYDSRWWAYTNERTNGADTEPESRSHTYATLLAALCSASLNANMWIAAIANRAIIVILMWVIWRIYRSINAPNAIEWIMRICFTT